MTVLLPDENETLFTARSLAAYLQVSERTVRALIASGKMGSVRVAGARRITPAQVQAYLTAQTEGRRR